MAKSKGYNNYRDYMHDLKMRFDYTPQDSINFHKSIEEIVIPICKKINSEKAKSLDIKEIRPWDTKFFFNVIPKGFNNIDELLEKMIKIFTKIKPEYGKYLEYMKNSNLLDLENRKGKAPGGYTFSLKDRGSSFIFTNFTGQLRDLFTFAHEFGHTLHNFRVSNLGITQYKENPSESAELASMSMELIFLEHLENIFDDQKTIIQIKLYKLKNSILFFPWCITIDAFQHWIYLNPNHSITERQKYFSELLDRFDTGINWKGLEYYKEIYWLPQPHIFSTPFYYIEYGMALLGALAIYRNYLKDPQKTIEQYDQFLRLGNSKSLRELYKTAGIEFNFSPEYIKEIIKFVENEIERLYSLL